MAIHHSKHLVSDDFEAVNRLIVDKIQNQDSLIDDLANHILQSGGKRLRPLLVLLSSHACNYQGTEHIRLAAMIEFLHTATLLHDDVVDESTLRRGHKTAHAIWGTKASILVGDYLFTLFMQLITQVDHQPIQNMLTDILSEVVLGEIKQYTNQHNSLKLEDYFAMIRAKTSLLFAASTSIGAMIAEQDPSIVQGLYDYGLHLGNAFQLIDDVLDYCADPQVIGKNLGDDLVNGKATLPLLHALEHGSVQQKEKIQLSLKTGTLEYFPEILAAIADTKAVAFTKSIAQKEVDHALTALVILPPSAYKNALEELAVYALERDY